MCVSGYMLLTIRVGRWDYFLQLFYLPEVRLYKNRTAISTFSVCRVVSRPIAPSFSMANSLISSDMLSNARERYKNTFTKVIFDIGCNKNRLEL